MSRSLPSVLEGVARALTVALVFLLPLAMVPVALDPLEPAKQTLLVTCALGAGLTWVASMASRRTFSPGRGWLAAAPLLVLAATAASSARSSAPYVSWIGGAGQEYLSVLSLFALATFFLVVSNLFSGEREHRALHATVIASAAIAGAVGTWFALSGQTFNTVGTLNALGIYLASAASFGCGTWVCSRPDARLLHDGWFGRIERAMIIALCVETVIVLQVAGYARAWMVFAAGLTVLLLVCFVRARDLHDARRLVIPSLLFVVSLPFAFGVPSLLTGGIPAEVTPSPAASMDIAVAVLDGEDGLLGSGPGTYAFDYALHRRPEVNQTVLWAERFDRGASLAHTLAPNVGLVGLFAWGVLLVGVGLRGASRAVGARAYRSAAGSAADLAGWVPLATAAFLYPGNVTLVFSLFLFSALVASRGAPVVESGPVSRPGRAGSGSVAAMALLSAGMLTALFVGAQRFRSDAALARAAGLATGGAQTEARVEELDRAAALNRFNDAAYRHLALALVRRADEVAARAGDGEGTVAAGDRALVRALAAAAVNAATRATDLSERNALNWLARGATYRALMPIVGNAGPFAVEAYARAIETEPLNPANHVELGKTYLAMAEAVRDETGSADAAEAEAARAELAARLADAERAFARAVELKPDYAPAHYQLAVTYDRQGRLDDAAGKMESVARYNPYDVGVAFQLGLLYMRRNGEGDLARARAELERAVELAPAYANARWFLASVYESEGSVPMAIEQIEKILEYDPGNALVTERLSRLRSGAVAPEPIPVPEAIGE